MNKPNTDQLEKLRIRVAELCEWMFHGETKFGPGCCPRRPGDMQYVGTMPVPLKEQWTPPGDWDGHPGTPLPPNYPEDLNACHEAEKALLTDSVDQTEYCEALHQLTGRDWFSEMTAEAWQRCIALDRTLSEHPIL